MEKIDLIKMSSKGQLVVPQDIREEAGFFPGQRFVAMQVDDGIFFKKIELPEVTFEKLTKDIRETIKKNKVTKKDLEDAIKWARKNSNRQ